jgi:hypothetical protein
MSFLEKLSNLMAYFVHVQCLYFADGLVVSDHHGDMNRRSNRHLSSDLALGHTQST